MNSTSEIRVTRLEAGDAAALATFYGDAWGASVSPDAVAAARRALTSRNPFTKETGALTVGVFQGDRLIGHLGTIAAEFWDGVNVIPALWLKGFMVLERYRNGPVGFMLIKETARHLGLTGVMTVAEPARRLMQAIGFKDVGVVANYLSVVRPLRLIRSLDPAKLGVDAPGTSRARVMKALRWPPLGLVAGVLAAAVFKLLDTASRLRTLGVTATLESEPPPAAHVDALWDRLRTRVGFAQTRTGGYVAWRYAENPAGGYEFIAARRAGRLVALAVVRGPRRDDPRLGGLRLGLIVDLVVAPDDARALTCVLLAARQWAKTRSCDAVLLTLSYAALRNRLLRAGYFGVPGNVHFMLRAGSSGVAVPGQLGSTWLTRGDAWGDDI